MTCVLDALDECRPRDRAELIDMLARFHKDAHERSSTTHRGRLNPLYIASEYLWLYLALDNIKEALQNCRQPQLAFAEQLPSSVEDAYEKILGQIGAKGRANTRDILRIANCHFADALFRNVVRAHAKSITP